MLVRIAFTKVNQQTTENTENALRALRSIVRLHRHTELKHAPARADQTNSLNQRKDRVTELV